MTFEVVHTTAYVYESPVSDSFGDAHLLPRELAFQQVLSSELVIDPAPDELVERIDYFGNRAHHFAIHEPHTTLSVTARSLVEVGDRGEERQLLADQPWAQIAGQLSTDPALRHAAEFTLPSPQLPASSAAAAYAVPSFMPGWSILEAVEHLSHRIFSDFDFRPGATQVGTPVETVLGRRVGVCQDFAHLTIAAARSVGLAARYVSGYLETEPPPGQEKLQGADVSHAWASVFIPQIGWVDIDPTNDQFVGSRYVTTGWGRDYGDIAPLKGVIFTDGDTQSLKVSVDVRRIAPPGPAAGRDGGEGPPSQSQSQSQSSGPLQLQQQGARLWAPEHRSEDR